MVNLKGKKVLVTGASGGIGKAIAIELSSNGVSVSATLPIDKVKNFKKGDKIEIEFPESFAQIINS